mmetsp:Transcript_37795/g.62673  ORF Transcript_37795/g.62673 Transcript_37795/m.62673 type:complete len:596 (+) Transcript_37795:1-1788(+)
MKLAYIVCLLAVIHAVNSEVRYSRVGSYVGQTCAQNSKRLDQCSTRKLVCLNNLCSYCLTDEDCEDKMLICGDPSDTHSKDAGGRVCVAKPLLKYERADVIGAVTTFTAGMLAAAGGIGGGILFLPLLVLSGYSAYFSVLVSECMIVGGMIANIAISIRRRHPKIDRPLIDYDVAMALLPPVVAGTIPGIFIYLMLKDWMILWVMATVLTWVLWKSYAKVKNIVEKERKTRAADKAKQKKLQDNTTASNVSSDKLSSNKISPPAEPSITIRTEGPVNQLLSKSAIHDASTLIPGPTRVHPKENNGPGANEVGVPPVEEVLLTNTVEVVAKPAVTRQGTVTVDLSAADGRRVVNVELQKILDREARTVPVLELFLFVLFLAAVLFLIYLPGKKLTPSFLDMDICSTGYWVVVATPFPLVLLGSIVIYYFLFRRQSQKAALGHVFKEGEVEWTLKKCLMTAPYCLLLGVVVGVLGIGGGIMLTPMLLEMNMHLQTLAATSSFIIFFLATVVLVQYFTAGLIPVDYFVFYFILGLLSFGIGLTVINKIVEKYKFVSVIAILLMGLMFLSWALCFGIGARILADSIQQNTNLTLNTVCP